MDQREYDKYVKAIRKKEKQILDALNWIARARLRGAWFGVMQQFNKIKRYTHDASAMAEELSENKK